MTTLLGGAGIPGQGDIAQTVEREIIWGGDDGRGLCLFKSAVISGATRDSSASTTTNLLPGLVLGQVTGSSEYEEYDADASDGTQIARAILIDPLKATDFNATNADRVWRILVRGPVKVTNLTGLDAQARRQLVGQGFLFADDLLGRQNFLGPALTDIQVVDDTTVTAANNGARYVATTADCTFTMPAIANGLIYEFLRASDHEMVVASAEGDNIIIGNDLSADSITFTSASEHIGAHVRMESCYVGTTLKWLPTLLTKPFSSDNYLATTFAT